MKAAGPAATGAALVTALGLAAATPARALGPGDERAACERVAAVALGRCFVRVSRLLAACHRDSGRACPTGDAAIAAEVAALDARVRNACQDDQTVRDLGHGPLLTRDAFADRLAEACLGHARGLAAGSFGGPQGAALAGGPGAWSCLSGAHAEGVKIARQTFRRFSRCAQRTRRGDACDADTVAATVDARLARSAARLAGRCADLETRIGSPDALFAERARRQGTCLTAAAHAGAGALGADCGPRAAVPVPLRGVWTQIVLDEAGWGTRCGDGSPYAFWIRLAPAGSPAENVLVHMQGGGVCVLGSDCSRRPSGLFEALSDYTASGGPDGGFLSADPQENPFADWTMLVLPYCTQDLFIGGGATQVFPEITVHRYGAVNVRAALRYLRDVLWAHLDATTADGYRPDLPLVLLSGASAGGFGTSYNYQFVVDDLGWIRTTGAPDSSLGLDIGALTALGVIATAPTGWGSQAFLPSYCFGFDCFPVTNLHVAHSERLKEFPHQQILAVSNQVDSLQRATTGFATLADWTTKLREDYCAMQGLPGLRFFLPADPQDIHVILRVPGRYDGLTADGVAAREWLEAAMLDPDGVVDRVEEGTLAMDLGADPFSCVVD